MVPSSHAKVNRSDKTPFRRKNSPVVASASLVALANPLPGGGASFAEGGLYGAGNCCAIGCNRFGVSGRRNFRACILSVQEQDLILCEHACRHDRTCQLERIF